MHSGEPVVHVAHVPGHIPDTPRATPDKSEVALSKASYQHRPDLRPSNETLDFVRKRPIARAGAISDI